MKQSESLVKPNENTQGESVNENYDDQLSLKVRVTSVIKPWKRNLIAKSQRSKKSNKKHKTHKTLKNNKIKKPKIKSEEKEGETEKGFQKVKAEKSNKIAHTTNGNRSHYKIMQVNSSNANFCSKLPELEAMINNNKSDIIVISEANAEIKDKDKMEERQKAFPQFNFEDKEIENNDKARCTIMRD